MDNELHVQEITQDETLMKADSPAAANRLATTLIKKKKGFTAFRRDGAWYFEVIEGNEYRGLVGKWID